MCKDSARGSKLKQEEQRKKAFRIKHLFYEVSCCFVPWFEEGAAEMGSVGWEVKKVDVVQVKAEGPGSGDTWSSATITNPASR